MQPTETPLLLWGMPQGPEWIIIAFIALLLFGTRLPAVARSMGRGITEFKRGLKDPTDDDEGDDGDDKSKLNRPSGESFQDSLKDDVTSDAK